MNTRGHPFTTGRGSRDENRDTILKDLAIILVDEKHEAGIGKEKGGKASDTFTIVATVSRKPETLIGFYERNGFGRETEMKYRHGGKNVRKVIDELLRTGAIFSAETVMKRSPNIPDGYNPSKAAETHRNVAMDVVVDAMARTDAMEINVYFDNHTAYRGGDVERIATEAAKETGKKIGESRMLRSKDEPLLQMCDFPTGAIGEYMESKGSCQKALDLYLRMAPRLNHRIIGKTSVRVSRNGKMGKG